MKLSSLGWNDRLVSLFHEYEQQDLLPGRIVRVDRGAVLVARETSVAQATLGTHLEKQSEPGPAAVGDWVAVDISHDEHFVRAVLPRTSLLTRRRPGAPEGSQPVAANIDIVLLAEGLDRGVNGRRIERGVALAYDCGATPVVVITKADLGTDLDDAIKRADASAPFTEVIVTSSVEGSGVDSIATLLAENKTAVLLGPSGAGKSTLVNRLLGEERLAAQGVRHGDHKGRHTTTRRELVVLPEGGCLIDTPGVRELGLWLEPEALEHAYTDIASLARDCRFTDCAHVSEPGCAVRAAVDTDELSPDRLAGYLKLRREAEALELRRDEGRRRARDRAFGRMVRTVKKIKDNR